MNKYALIISGVVLASIISKRGAYSVSTSYAMSSEELRTLIENIKTNNPDLKYIPTWLIMGFCETESSFRTHVVSKAGAIGLMQLLPNTYTWIRNEAKNHIWNNGDIYDPYNNVLAGMCYIDWLYWYYNGDWFAVIQAYNLGIGNYNKNKRNRIYLSKVLTNGLTWLI